MSLKLINNLTREFNRDELQGIVENFFSDLINNNPDIDSSKINSKQIAEYLVNGQPDGEGRLQALQFFLESAKPLSKETSDLFGYLLHTLVKNLNKDSLIELPVNRMQTVELIDAAQKAIPSIPDYGKEDLDFQNGARLSQSHDKVDFEPESGLVDPQTICQKIAFRLLIAIKDPNFIAANGQPTSWEQIQTEVSSKKLNPLEILSGRIVSNPQNPADSPLRYLLIHKEKLANHPLNVPENFRIFNYSTKKRLPVYTYGKDSSSNTEDCLHVSEEDIRGILLGEIISNYHGNNRKEQNMKPEKESNTVTQNINNSTIYGSLSAAGSNHEGMHINSNYTINPDVNEQLQLALAELLQKASQQESVNKQDYAELSQAVNQIKNELQIQKNTDNIILSKAKTVLEGFKTAEGIGASVEKILKLFSKLFI